MEQKSEGVAALQQWGQEILGRIKAMEEIQYVERIRSKFRVKDVLGKGNGFLRVGQLNDGGYVMWDDFDGVRVAYSVGIERDVSWDIDMAKRGIQVYQYDHTIDSPPEICSNFHFSKKGLTGIWRSEHPEMETLPRLIAQNGHSRERNMVLKMDIEGSERSVLREIDINTLRQFSQIVIEFHDLCNSKFENDLIFGLDKLNATHQLVYVHGNNHRTVAVRGGKVLPDVLETTYLRRDDYQFKSSSQCFPTSLDFPNAKGKADILLGYWG